MNDSWKSQPGLSLLYHTFPICWLCFYTNYTQNNLEALQIVPNHTALQVTKSRALSGSPKHLYILILRQPQSAGAKPCLIKAIRAEEICNIDHTIGLLLKTVRRMAVPKPCPRGFRGLRNGFTCIIQGWWVYKAKQLSFALEGAEQESQLSLV